MLLYALTIFLSAFLLFQVQPLIAKTILAWFGGSAAVWTTCMLFFQIVLLLGYFYSHYIVKRLKPRSQAMLHTALLVAAGLLLPVIPNPSWKPTGTENPTLQILLLLASTVGLPYLLCSTTGPLVQAWYARREHDAAPYRLFALSNLGSMLALLSYPPLVEPNLPTKSQAWIWSGGFLVFALLCVVTAWRSAAAAETATEEPEASGAEAEADPAPTLGRKSLWVALASCPSLLMLAVTNHLTQDVAAIPFLWILPLSVYLLSFILTFDARAWYRRNLFLVLLAPALGFMSYSQWGEAKDLDMRLTIGLFCLAFFIACMVCHGELAARKPTPRHLTSFYLMLSVGGALGGLFAALVSPYLFPAYFELPVGLGLCALLAFLVATEEPGLTWKQRYVSVSSICLGVGMLGLWVFLARTVVDDVKGYVVAKRNFYGTLRVREVDPAEWEGYRTLLHGSINHGEQWTHPDRRREHITYYCSDSGAGRAMKHKQASGAPIRVGVLGLGAGSMASFARANDYYRFYEINPLVPGLADKYFTYVRDCRAKHEIVMGDGRLSLEREPDQNFDILMMDAFSGDSIPVHLVTRDVFGQYFRHLKPDGLIVIHISNKYLDLKPVLARVSEKLRKPAYVVEADDDESGTCFGTTYVLFANDASIFEKDEFRGAGYPPRVDPAVQVWTDDYSNLFRILK